jgi:hypothetical protein
MIFSLTIIVVKRTVDEFHSNLQLRQTQNSPSTDQQSMSDIEKMFEFIYSI